MDFTHGEIAVQSLLYLRERGGQGQCLTVPIVLGRCGGGGRGGGLYVCVGDTYRKIPA